MDAIQDSLNEMMSSFNRGLESIQGQLSSKPGSPDSVEIQFAAFKSFVMTSLQVLQSQIAILAQQVDHIEMRGRRKILLLHGIPESPKENTIDVIVGAMKEKLKLDKFTAADVSRCHRMGRETGKVRPRPILFKLNDVGLRDKIWSSKTTLKGSGVTLSEFLTKTRHDVFVAARQRFGVTKTWTREGCVYVLGPDSVRHRINSLADLDTILSQGARSPAAGTSKVSDAGASIEEATAKALRQKQRRIAAKK